MDESTLEAIAEFICGDNQERFPTYRSGGELTRFFARAGLDRFRHDGSTRKWWTLESLKVCSESELKQVIARLANPREYSGDKIKVNTAITVLNDILNIEGLSVELDGAQPVFKEIKPSFTIESENGEKEEVELQPLEPPEFDKLGLESGIDSILYDRWVDTDTCLHNAAFIPALVMMGSLLEGMLLGTMQRFPKEINQAKSAPKDSNGKIKNFAEWSLSQMIDCAHEVGWIGLDVKKFSHAVRFFRNFIHPYEQMMNKFEPDEDTCQISWLVVQAAVNDLAEVLQSKK